MLIAGTATEGSDYTAPSAISLTFPANSSMQCGITAFDDDALEGNETFTVMLSTSETFLLVAINEASVTITDNDGKIETLSSAMTLCYLAVVTVSLPPDLSFPEDAGTEMVCATLSALSPTQRSVEVTLTTTDGSGRRDHSGMVDIVNKLPQQQGVVLTMTVSAQLSPSPVAPQRGQWPVQISQSLTIP